MGFRVYNQNTSEKDPSKGLDQKTSKTKAVEYLFLKNWNFPKIMSNIVYTYIVKFHICNSASFEPRYRIYIFFIDIYAGTLFDIYDKGRQSAYIITLICWIL